ncbi:polysaccharide deacetylase family protein [Bacillus cereus]|uniref:NodB homology domain-containing protein n=1 Tax=Bacillus cereus VD184 TaxID=1053242 RepID=A0A9W5R0Y6_BACCE|nr:polysaccharide deacetylase family protein [Bacillus cereus]EOQ02074.1 hypothetical protein IKC_04756 [Bacillus cereus VD184]
MKKKIWFLVLLFIFSVSLFFFYKQHHKPFPQTKKISGNGCLVLNYHRVRSGNALVKFLAKISGNPELNTYTVYKDDFIKQISFLKRNGFYFITPEKLSAYIKKKNIPGKCALITFDDIDRSVFNNAYPFLKQQKIPFTIFIITGEVGRKYFNGLRMARWEEIIEMQDTNLVTIGVHTHKLHYIEEGEKPPFLKTKNLSKFIEDSNQAKKSFYAHLGYEPKYFAYPYGYGTPKTDDVLLAQNYDLIFTLSPGIVDANSPNFFIKRILVDDISWEAIKKWINND